MSAITQAIILAGGRGTRLAPLTDTQPKPLIEVGGRPFIEYLLAMLKQQGIGRILLLLGYRAQMMIDHLGNGGRFGLELNYSVTPDDDETGLRLSRAAARLDPEFLLMYCDNYWPLSLERLVQNYRRSKAPMQITVYDNSDGYTRDNVCVENGFLVAYDKSRRAPNLKGVDIGYAIMHRELIDRLPPGNPSLEAALYPSLIAERQMAAYMTSHRYYSIGSHDRLPRTKAFLARPPTVILDRDGVLNVRVPRAEYVRNWAEWHWTPSALRALAALKSAGWRVIIVTNQAGIARGVMSEADLAAIHACMKAEAEGAGGHIDAVYHCPHDWDANCACRKPKPGMLFQAQRDFDLDLSRVPFVGDDERDGQAADSAGCRFVPYTGDALLSDVVNKIINEASGNA